MADTNRPGAPKPATTHVECPNMSTDMNKIFDGDKALDLIDNLNDMDMHQGFEPGEEKRLVQKIDMMILPFLSVCYAFYYVSNSLPLHPQLTLT